MVWRQAIIWTNGDLLWNFHEIWIKVQDFSFIEMHLKMLTITLTYDVLLLIKPQEQITVKF